MALPTPPDLSDASQPIRPLARSYLRGHEVDSHAHSWGQLLYATSGVMWVYTPGEALMVPPQRAVWIPPDVPHGIRVMSALEMRNIYLRPTDAGQFETQVQVLEVNPLLRELILAFVEQLPHGTHYQALAELTLLELQRAPRAPLRVPLPPPTDRRLASLCQAVLAEPSLEISFEQHAEQVGASVRTLARLFDIHLGVGFAQWRRQVHLAIAMAELIQGIPVGRIARELGYTPSSFSDMFRRALGCAPTDYAVR